MQEQKNAAELFDSEPNPHECWTLDNCSVAKHVWVFESLASTNTTAANLAAKSDCDGVGVVAYHQTRGRGQYGRVWQSQPGASLLMSVILQPPRELLRPALLTAVAAIAVARAIDSITSDAARIKWPNDVHINGKKISGILIELHRSTAIIGIGLNLNQSREDFVRSDLPDATSLRLCSGTGHEVRRAGELVLHQLDAVYGTLKGGQRHGVEDEWNARIGLTGYQVSVELMDGTKLSARLTQLTFDQLVLQCEGEMRTLVPESIRHMVISGAGVSDPSVVRLDEDKDRVIEPS